MCVCVREWRHWSQVFPAAVSAYMTQKLAADVEIGADGICERHFGCLGDGPQCRKARDQGCGLGYLLSTCKLQEQDWVQLSKQRNARS